MRKEYKKSEVIRTPLQLSRLAKKMSKLEEFAYDTETNTLRVYGPNKDFKLVGISISWGEYNNYYIPTGHIFDDDQLTVRQVVRKLKPIFENPNIRIIGHNLKFDLHVLERIGISVKTNDLIDTMILSWICDENEPKGLKENTERILKVDQTHFADVLTTVTNEQKKSQGLKANQKARYDMVTIENGAPYAIADAFYTWQIYLYYLDRVEAEGMDKIFYKTYPQFLRTLYNMEVRGITVDVPKLKKMGVDMAKDLEELEYSLLELAGVHIELGSNQQLAQLLFGFVADPKNPKNDKDFNYLPKEKQQKKLDDYKKKLREAEEKREEVAKYSFNFPVQSTTAKGAPQVNGATLERLSKMIYKNKRKATGVEFCRLLLEHKKLSKLKSAFVDGLIEQLYDDGRAHPSFNIVGTDSGRISCSSPNLMQLPNAEDDDKYQIRDVFIGDYNEELGEREKIISVDYSNLEVRVMAHFSQDKGLIDAFHEGKDLHGNTAKMMFRLECDANDVKKKFPHLRQQGKVIAFLLQYGGSSMTLYDDLNKDGNLDLIADEQRDDKKSDFYGCKDGKAVAQRLMDLYFAGFPGIAKFMKHQKKVAHRQGYINTLVGRKRRLPGIYSNSYGDVAYNERLSINACIQGSGADIMMNAQNKIEGTSPCKVSNLYIQDTDLNIRGVKEKFIASDRLKELGCKMLIQIHDELIFSCPAHTSEEAVGIIRDCMIHPFGEKVKLNVNLDVGAGISDSYQGGH